MPYGSLSKAYRTEIALGHLHANLVSLFKIRQRRLQKTKSMSGNINNRGKYKKKPIYKKKPKKNPGMLQMECKWSRPTDWSSFISLSAKKKKQYYGIDLPKKRVSGERQMHVYDSQNSQMLKPLSFTCTICRGGGSF